MNVGWSQTYYIVEDGLELLIFLLLALELGLQAGTTMPLYGAEEEMLGFVHTRFPPFQLSHIPGTIALHDILIYILRNL